MAMASKLRECKSRLALKEDKVIFMLTISLRRYNTPDALYDVAWAENCETQLLTACGDGSVKLFDTKSQGEDPVSEWNEHGREVYSVAYNLITKDTFVSSSWDGTIKIVGSQLLPLLTERS